MLFIWFRTLWNYNTKFKFNGLSHFEMSIEQNFHENLISIEFISPSDELLPIVISFRSQRQKSIIECILSELKYVVNEPDLTKYRPQGCTKCTICWANLIIKSNLSINNQRYSMPYVIESCKSKTQTPITMKKKPTVELKWMKTVDPEWLGKNV